MVRKNRKQGLRLLSALLAVSLLLGGCGAGQTGAETSGETTQAGPGYDILPDGDPKTVSCKGSYSLDPFAANTAVATVGEAKLTNGELNAFYHLIINSYEPQNGEPDFSQPLDGQLKGDISWEQYFLQQALDTWFTLRAVEQKSLEYSERTEEGFIYSEQLHKKYMSDMPANKYLYTLDNTFKPNTMHQKYLDELPQLLRKLAEEKGYADVQDMVDREMGPDAVARDLQKAVQLANWSYMYYTDMSYDHRPKPEDVEKALKPGGSQVIDFRHILVIPEGGIIQRDETVKATEEQWDQGEAKARELIEVWMQNWERDEFSFAALAHDNSKDPGTALNGGLLQNIRKGQLIEPLDRWCFAENRKPGDIDVVRSDYGWHVMYFCAARDENYEQTANGLLLRDMDKLIREAKEAYPIRVDYEKITLDPVAGQGKLTFGEDLLYPDVAHERIPEVPVYVQQDYLGVRYGSRTVSSHGCGITTLAMLSSYMADEFYTPGLLAVRYRGRYSNEGGTDGMIFVQKAPELGFFFEEKVFDIKPVLEALRIGKKAVSLQHPGYFTRGGHYLCLSELRPDGKVVIRDSNIYNYGRLPEHKQDAFPASKIPEACQGGYWIFDYKIVSLPNCVRCGSTPDPRHIDPNKIPPLLKEDYLCPKCRAALTRRNGFLEAAGLN